ncbi:MAG: hypothetical protein NTW50_00565 [Candidatus Berkelbacteria bacterium]|nr:hypothetical protein [Candidatus Berkelbacteria bacterium]
MELAGTIRHFDECLKLKRYTDAFSIIREIENSAEGLNKILDPDRLKLRQKIAKERNFEYVGPVNGEKAFVGAKLLHDGQTLYYYLVHKEDSLLGVNTITPFINGSAWATISGVNASGEIYENTILVSDEGEILLVLPFTCKLVEDIQTYDGSPMMVRPQRILNDRYFITAKGKKIMEGRTDPAHPSFHDGVVWGMNDQMKSVLFDEDGNELFVLDAWFDLVEDFRDGVALAEARITKKIWQSQVYAIDKTGKYRKIEGVIREGTNQDGSKIISVITPPDGLDGKYFGWQEEDGSFIFDLDGNKTYCKDIPSAILNNGLCLIPHTFPNGEEVKLLIDSRTGRVGDGVILKADAGVFKEGLMKVTSHTSDKEYYLNKDGQLIGKGYLEANDFSEGVALAKDEKGWFAIDKSGGNNFNDKELRFKSLPTLFSDGVFKNGVVLVTAFDDETYFIDKKGRRVFG